MRGRRRTTSKSTELHSKKRTVFADPLANIFDDPDHSSDERRELIIGHSVQQRLLVVNFTDRPPRTRIIGAREATAHERHDYEQNTAKRST